MHARDHAPGPHGCASPVAGAFDAVVRICREMDTGSVASTVLSATTESSACRHAAVRRGSHPARGWADLCWPRTPTVWDIVPIRAKLSYTVLHDQWQEAKYGELCGHLPEFCDRKLAP